LVVLDAPAAAIMFQAVDELDADDLDAVSVSDNRVAHMWAFLIGHPDALLIFFAFSLLFLLRAGLLPLPL